MKYNFSSLALVNANERKVKKEREEKKLKNRIKKIFRKIKQRRRNEIKELKRSL